MQSRSRAPILGFFAAFGLCVAASNPAWAVDGVLEISQHCVATGCFPGDTPGFPVTLPTGNYRLTSDLDVRNESIPHDVTAILIVGEYTTLDLNGFTIIGPVQCTGTPPNTCGTTGVGDGIFSNQNLITIRNGRILGMGNRGISLVSAGRVENVHVESCGGDGIKTGQGSYVASNVSRRNAGRGIGIGSVSILRDNVVDANLGDGIVLGHGSSGYTNNVSSRNIGAQVSGSGTQLGPNLCGTSVCP